MELRHLRYFVALADTLSFTRAAERVHVTQSTLSHQIRQLEDEIGRALNRPVGTVKTWLHRARADLAEHLTRRGVTPP